MRDKIDARHVRMPAEQRREAVLDAAVTEFATYGLHGASTEAIAARAGISQPYVFRLFGTKKDLFLAAAERVYARIRGAFGEAVQDYRAGNSPCDDVLSAMGLAFTTLLARREELLLLAQGFAACEDPDVREVMRRRFEEIYDVTARVSGASDEEVRTFMAHGMLLMVGAAMDLPAIAEKHEWARKYLGMC